MKTSLVVLVVAVASTWAAISQDEVTALPGTLMADLAKEEFESLTPFDLSRLGQTTAFQTLLWTLARW
jgi:hypothetical protein